MKFLTVSTVSALLLSTPALSSVTVSYDESYDAGSRSLSTVACSDGSNGLLTKGYHTLQSLPSFPRVGGAFTIGEWNSASCGKCYKLSYQGHSVNVLAVDYAGSGFNIGLSAMNALTGGQARQRGRVQADFQEVSRSACGMK
jgi:hypothetical protein